MNRTVAALKVCREKIQARHVTRSRLIATEACRAAANSDEFLARVAEEARLDLEIVSRETEAFLAAAGCASLADPEADGIVLFDIGGGSSARWSGCPATPSRRAGGATAGSTGRCAIAYARGESMKVGVVTPRRAASAATIVTPEIVRGHGREGRRDGACAFRGGGCRAEHAVQQAFSPSGDVGHRHHHRRGPSRPRAIRASAQSRRPVDGRTTRSRLDDRRAARHVVRGACDAQRLHRSRPRRSRSGRLRHLRCDPPRLPPASAFASPTAACARAS